MRNYINNKQMQSNEIKWKTGNDPDQIQIEKK